MAHRLTGRARRDVLDIWRRIAADSEPSADRFIDRLTQHFRLLGKAPFAGRQRDDIRPGYRSFPVGEYLIFYRIMEPGVRIMHVVHGRKDLRRYPFD
ncbi:MAG TPA: type II toxin-antitoxin system RelE/ParE family toxin [Candidatus Acidoferrales bacterium]|jgi:toxin ParE1/3/4|nr:type II toxin-antitoxin system RelE/ParE family toxin [Candidatus Acidoferrales bacterium]